MYQGLRDTGFILAQLVQTEETKETKRIAALERKALLYEELRKRVNLDDELANSRHEVDFVAKALLEDEFSHPASPDRDGQEAETPVPPAIRKRT